MLEADFEASNKRVEELSNKLEMKDVSTKKIYHIFQQSERDLGSWLPIRWIEHQLENTGTILNGIR